MQSCQAYIACEHPNNALYKFEGTIQVEEIKDKGSSSSRTISLGADNVLLRGMNVRNTEALYGMVVFTGHDTKIMKNSAPAVYKFSKLETMMNRSILMVFGLQTLLAFIGAVVGYQWSEGAVC